MDMTGNCNHYAKSPLRRAFSLYTKRKRTKGGDGALPFYSKEIYSIDDFILWDISAGGYNSISGSSMTGGELQIISSSCRIISSITADSKISFMFFLP